MLLRHPRVAMCLNVHRKLGEATVKGFLKCGGRVLRRHPRITVRLDVGSKLGEAARPRHLHPTR